MIITAFWVLMNFLLWRAEFGGGRETASDVPVELVIRKVLTSADRSTLTVQHLGQRIGQLQWVPSVLEDSPVTKSDSVSLPDGMVRSASGYLLEADLSLSGEEPSSRWRTIVRLELGTNLAWRTVEVKVIQRPNSWQFKVRAGDDTVRVRTETGRTSSEQTFTSADLRQWSTMLGPVKAFLPPAMTAADPVSAWKEHPGLGLQWKAGDDWLKVGKQRIRAYSLHTRILDRYEIVAYFSRAGELLRLNLPDRYELTNDAVAPLDHAR